jgi:hypothetical protein
MQHDTEQSRSHPLLPRGQTPWQGSGSQGRRRSKPLYQVVLTVTFVHPNFYLFI